MAFPSTLIINYIYLSPLRTTKEFFSVKLSETAYNYNWCFCIFLAWSGHSGPDYKGSGRKASSINNGSLIQGRALYYRNSSWNRAYDIDSAKKNANAILQCKSG